VFAKRFTRSPVLPCLSRSPIFSPPSPNPFRIRTSMTPFPQPLYNPHFRDPLGSADSKALTAAVLRPQLLYFPHLQDPPGSAGNKGVIIPLESALTKNPPATPLESALTKNRGVGGTFFKPKAFFLVRSTAPSLFTSLLYEVITSVFLTFHFLRLRNLSFSASRNSFICHSLVPSAVERYGNNRGEYQLFPSWSTRRVAEGNSHLASLPQCALLWGTP